MSRTLTPASNGLPRRSLIFADLGVAIEHHLTAAGVHQQLIEAKLEIANEVRSAAHLGRFSLVDFEHIGSDATADGVGAVT